MWHAKSNQATQLRVACLEHDVDVENVQMRRRASLGVLEGEARSLHREPVEHETRSRRMVLVSIRVLDVSMERPRHRKPRNVLLGATRVITRTSSDSKVEQHKTQ